MMFEFTKNKRRKNDDFWSKTLNNIIVLICGLINDSSQSSKLVST